jgi:methylsterol monooxygenase
MAAAGPSMYDQLYSNVDYSALNVLERFWVQWYVTIGNPVLATGLMSFLLHEVS